MDSRDQDIYSLCLFRSISLHELKSEMLSRAINFSPCDPYYILTLKLRREILMKNPDNENLLKQLDADIKAADETKSPPPGAKYKCCLPGCSFLCSNHIKYLAHLEFVHYNCKSRLVCQFRHSCSREFPSFKMLEAHVKNIHKKRPTQVQLRQNQLVEQLTKLRCIEKSCGNQLVSSIAQLKVHLYTHTSKKETVQCLFCSYKCDTSGTLKSHFSRKHKIQTVELMSPGYLTSDLPSPEDFGPAGDVNSPLDDSVDNTDDTESVEVSIDDLVDDVSEELFIKALAITVSIVLFAKGFISKVLQQFLEHV